LTGGRIHGDELIARANLRDARDRLQQARDNAALDARNALNALQQAEATLASNQSTAAQAQRAYDIAQVRYREGISTQLDLNDARNQLAQALTNRAQASRDVLVASGSRSSLIFLCRRKVLDKSICRNNSRNNNRCSRNNNRARRPNSNRNNRNNKGAPRPARPLSRLLSLEGVIK
jgi:hypothetical protein